MTTQNRITNKPAIQSLLKSFEQFNQLSETLTLSVEGLNVAASSLNPAHLNESGINPDAQNNPQEEQLRALIDAIPGGVVVLDPQGKITEANASARELLGEASIQQSWRDIVQRVFLAELDQGELKTPQGAQYSISTRPLGYAPGQILLLSDVTQTRNLQRAAQQNLHLMTMGKMMASLAHQIRTPLASSMLYLSQVVTSELDKDTSLIFSRKALGRIKHIEKMINDMLVFAHGGQFNMTRFSVSDLFEELQENIKPQLEQRSANLSISRLPSNIQFQGNKDALLGALGNLCMNALDASKSQASIKITTRLSNHGLLQIKLDDSGCGMDKQTRMHIFDPFFTTKMDGTGLGLAVVKSVIESHQGSITVASRAQLGTRFIIYLPCIQAVRTQLSNSNSKQDRGDKK